MGFFLVNIMRMIDGFDEFHWSNLPRNTIPIACAFSRGNEIVAYVVPLSAAKPESSD